MVPSLRTRRPYTCTLCHLLWHRRPQNRKNQKIELMPCKYNLSVSKDICCHLHSPPAVHSAKQSDLNGRNTSGHFPDQLSEDMSDGRVLGNRLRSKVNEGCMRAWDRQYSCARGFGCLTPDCFVGSKDKYRHKAILFVGVEDENDMYNHRHKLMSGSR